MPRAGLDRAKVTATAAVILDEEGADSLSLARVAGELGVKSPSLYNHIDSLDGLIRSIALDGIEGLAEVCRTASMGLAGPDALRSLLRAYREYAAEHPGVYPLTQVARPDDEAFAEASAKALEPAQAVLASFGIEGEDLIHVARAVRSAVHGFCLLETTGGFGLEQDPEASFDRLIDLLSAGLSNQA